MSVTPVNERLAALTAAGTSVWLDQLRRGMIESGELERMVVEESLRGVTSNPAIFEKAILGSPDYDDDLAEGAREGLSAREVYRRLGALRTLPAESFTDSAICSISSAERRTT